MRKFIFVIGAIFALASCSKSNSFYVDVNNREAITFETYATENTKGLPIYNNATFEKDGTTFEISAFSYLSSTDSPTATSAYLGSQEKGLEVLRVKNLWVPSLSMYWPTGNHELDFYAIKRYNNQLSELKINPINYPQLGTPSIDNTTSSISFKYDSKAAATIKELEVGFGETSRLGDNTDRTAYTSLRDSWDPESPYRQDDIMYASTFKVPSPHADNYIEANGHAVKLKFKHALTQIQFKAQTQPEIKVSIKAITVHNIKSTGTFSQTTTHRSEGAMSTETRWVADPLGSTSMFNVSIPWSGVTVDTNISQPLSFKREGDKIVYTDHTLMLIPQKFSAWEPSVTITDNNRTGGALGGYIMVYCDIYLKTLNRAEFVGNEGHVFGNKMPLHLSRKPDASQCIYIPLSSQDDTGIEIWKAGSKITYNLIFGGGYDAEGDKVLDPVDFTVTVDSWNPGDDSDIEPPLENDTNSGTGEDLTPGTDLTN